MKASFPIISRHTKKVFTRKCFSLLLCFANLLLFLQTNLHSQPQVTHGPVVGAVTSPSAKILVRVDAQANVRFDLDTDAAFSNPVPTATVSAEPDSDYFAIIPVQGLAPETKYYYRAVLDNIPRQNNGSFWTFPQEGSATTFTFAFGGCQQASGDPNSNIDGELQMDWLIRELQASTATWKFIGTSVQFNPSFTRAVIEYALLLGRGQNPLPIPTAPIAHAAADSWGGFPHSVARLVKAVHEAQIENIIMLSGDSHTAAIDDGANSLFPEVMAGGLDRTNSRTITLAEFFGIFCLEPGRANDRTQ